MYRKIRTYPPIIVNFLTVLILAVASFNEISNGTSLMVEVIEVVTIEEPPETKPCVSTHAETGISPATADQPEYTYNNMTMSRDFCAEDSNILLKIAMAEAEGESTEGKALVILVVLNRVLSDQFPDTIEDVVFQSRQFSTVREGGRYWTTEPDRDCYEALELIMHGWDESDGALYFESDGESSWHSENLEYLYQLGKHKFYR